MTSVMRAFQRTLATVFLLVAIPLGMLLPQSGAPQSGELTSAALVVAVIAMVLVVAANSFVLASRLPQHARARAALERLVPSAAQSDPDAPGHARPRAPSRLLTAV